MTTPSEKQAFEEIEEEPNVYLNIYQKEVEISEENIGETVQNVLSNVYQLQNTLSYSFGDFATVFRQLIERAANRKPCTHCKDKEMKAEVLREQNSTNVHRQAELRKELADLKQGLAERERKIEAMLTEGRPVTRASSKRIVEETTSQTFALPTKQLHLSKEAELMVEEEPSGFVIAANIGKKKDAKRKAAEFDFDKSPATKKKGGQKKAKTNADDETMSKNVRRVVINTPGKSPLKEDQTLGKFSQIKPIGPYERSVLTFVDSQKHSVDKNERPTLEAKATPISHNRYETDVTPQKESQEQFDGRPTQKKDVQRQLTFGSDSKPKAVGFETIFSSSSNGADSDKGLSLNFGALDKPATEVSLGKPTSDVDENSRRLYIKLTPVAEDTQKDKKDRYQRQGFICAQCAEFNLAENGILPPGNLCPLCASRRSNHPLNQTPEIFGTDKVFTPP